MLIESRQPSWDFIRSGLSGGFCGPKKWGGIIPPQTPQITDILDQNHEKLHSHVGDGLRENSQGAYRDMLNMQLLLLVGHTMPTPF